eukprot:TRINITY_DN35264_c0_g1_i1.p1 TRINITY_DN35264_c0_g1~~TRINITY_DN35264_c0_g1_i1.p1  ORF type:complete len:140 (-),score=21.30 TRINITY_DN35264_c0_g1_i1:150-569(-)
MRMSIGGDSTLTGPSGIRGSAVMDTKSAISAKTEVKPQGAKARRSSVVRRTPQPAATDGHSGADQENSTPRSRSQERKPAAGNQAGDGNGDASMPLGGKRTSIRASRASSKGALPSDRRAALKKAKQATKSAKKETIAV